MSFPLPPVRRPALARLFGPGLRWLMTFDPFGPFDGRVHVR